MDEYKYNTLNGPSNIRLLHILAEPTDESIPARLEEVQLEEKLEYCALSYVWGTEHPKWSIRIGNQNIMIRKSLFQAIKRVWKSGWRKVWADAVCINQLDMDERAQQVMIMRQIYESAALIIVHLGETSDTAKLDMLFPALLKLVDGHFQFGRDPNDRPAYWRDLQKQYGLPNFRQDVWQTLVDLANHAWFRRVWTFQEILVARKCLFVRGDWLRFSNDVLPVFQVICHLGLSGYIDRVEKMDSSGIDLAGMRCISVLRRQGMRFDNQELSMTWQRSPLIQLLRESNFSQSTNPRDRVYALLGVSNEADEEELKPNYIETADQAFSRVARFFVKRGQGPQLLENTTFAISTSTLPSWIPCWSNPRHFGVILPAIDLSYIGDSTYTAPQFNASLNTKEAFQLNGTETILIGQGVIFDTIKSLGSSEFLVTSPETLPRGGPDGTVALKSTIQYINEIYRMLDGSLGEKLDVEKLFHIICDIAICERLHGREAPKSVWKGLGIFLRVAYNHVDPCEMDIRFLTLIIMTIISSPQLVDTPENRKLASDFQLSAFDVFSRCLRCLTEKGYVGQVPQNAQVGDKIAILKGCEVPYLLREVGDHLYKIISNCYIHGVMHGEAWPRHDTNVHEIRIL